MKSKKKKNPKRILIIIIILIILLLVISLIYFLVKRKASTQSADQPIQIIYPINVSYFSKLYDGKVEETYIMEKITKLRDYIVNNKQNIDNLQNDEMINREYENNKDIIKDIGIQNVEDYKKIINQVQKIKEQNIQYSYAELMIDTFDETNEFSTIDVDIKFVGYDPLQFYLEIYNNYDDISSAVHVKSKI